MAFIEFSLGDDETVRRWFADRLAERGGADVRLVGWQRMPQGHSNDTFFADLTWVQDARPQRQRFVIRRDIVHGIMEPYDIPKEFRLLKALNDTEVASPRVYWMEDAPSVFGSAFYVMEYCRGTLPEDFWWNKGLLYDAAPEQRREMHRAYVEQLARIHTTDWQAMGLEELAQPKGLDFQGAPRPGTTDAAERAVMEWETKARRDQLEPEPLLEEPLYWLKTHLPVCPKPTLTHGDCKMSNYMFDDRRVVAIFDWEWARITDPMWDLSWSGAMFVGDDRFLEGMLSPPEFKDYYEELTGIEVDMERIQFYSVIGMLKACAFYPGMGRVFQQETSHDLRYAGMSFSTAGALQYINNICGLGPFAVGGIMGEAES